MVRTESYVPKTNIFGLDSGMMDRFFIRQVTGPQEPGAGAILPCLGLYIESLSALRALLLLSHSSSLTAPRSQLLSHCSSITATLSLLRSHCCSLTAPRSQLLAHSSSLKSAIPVMATA